MHKNEQLITDFYTAFSKRDAEAMAACYAPDIRFSDPVFQDLRGEMAGRMWRMLCTRGKDLTLVFSGIQADDERGRAHWEADYTFSATGRHVHNVIDATFTFRGGKILTHTDSFDLHGWTRQALGPAGLLLGWTSFLQNKVRRTAMDGLEKFVPR
jgi:ketosteroid isomerase-like protein